MAVKKKNKFNMKIVLNTLLIILVLFSLIADVLFVYYKFINDDKTIGVFNISSQISKELALKRVEDMTESELQEHEDRTFITANLYSNDKDNGIQLQEMNLNYFSDYSLTRSAYRSSGMQFIGDSSVVNSELIDAYAFGLKTYHYEKQEDLIYKNFIFYDTTNGISWNGQVGNNSSSSKLRMNSHLIIQIDGEPYEIQMNKSTTSKGYLGGFIEISSVKWYANYASLFQSVMQAVKTNNAGYGDYYITIDLSDFFTIRKYDVNSGKFLADDVTDVIKEYAEMKFHYDANGATSASQSIYGIINCSSSYGLTDEERNTEYWSENIVLNYNLNVLSTRFSEVLNGYYVSLDTTTKNKLKENSKIKLDVTIDLSNTDKNIIGLDYNAFYGVRIGSLKVLGNGEFVLSNGSLFDTGLNLIQHSDGVTIINNGATNNEYVEVVL